MTDNHNRLDELTVGTRDNSISRGYSRFVKLMKYSLPLTAVILMVVVITWPEMNDKIAIIPKEDLIPQNAEDIGSNELLNPRFETTDAQANPVNVTADRALQNQQNPNLVRLEEPNADLKTKDGANVNIKANDGTYEQESEKLFLQNNVRIKHESGYELQGEELRVNMKTREAFSDKDVRVEGPEANIDAKGLEGNVESGILIFKGPATLTLKPKDNAMKNEESGMTNE